MMWYTWAYWKHIAYETWKSLKNSFMNLKLN